MSKDWIRTDTQEPPERVVVDAMDSGGHVQPLKRIGRLWFVPDGSIYVYFVPTFWKHRSA